MECLKEATKRFYKEKETLLHKNYPGISLDRLLQEVERFSFESEVSPATYQDSTYLPSSSSHIQKYFEALIEGVPLAYISGKSYFFNSEFIVSPDVLIPRMETEVLVEKALEILLRFDKGKTPSVIDIGTGSGAILLSLLREVRRPVEAVASDIDSKALEIAKKNYYHLEYSIHPKTSVLFKQMDRLERAGRKFDMILSNPPYIMKEGDHDGVHSQVDRFEPHVALYLDDKKYDAWFDLFFTQVNVCLKPGGSFLMEGHEHHLERLSKKLKTLGFRNVQVAKDLTGRDRFLFCVK